MKSAEDWARDTLMNMSEHAAPTQKGWTEAKVSIATAIRAAQAEAFAAGAEAMRELTALGVVAMNPALPLPSPPKDEP